MSSSAEEEDREKREVTAYLEAHALAQELNDAVNDVVSARPDNPMVALSELLKERSPNSHDILQISATQVLSTSSSAALEVTVTTVQGPFRATTCLGPFDGDEDSPPGRGVAGACEAVRTILAEKLVGLDVRQQKKIDEALEHEHVPANAVLAVSIACCKAGAKHMGLELCDYIAKLASLPEVQTIPTVMTSLVNGGSFARGSSAVFVQDVLLIPRKKVAPPPPSPPPPFMPTSSSASLPEVVSTTPATALPWQSQSETGNGLRMCYTVMQRVQEGLRKSGFCNVNLGRRGGLAPGASNRAGGGTFNDVMQCVVDAVADGSYGGTLELAIDVHASKLFGDLPTTSTATSTSTSNTSSSVASDKYEVGRYSDNQSQQSASSSSSSSTVSPPTSSSSSLSANDLLDLYTYWVAKYPLSIILDPFDRYDKDMFRSLGEKADEALLATKEKFAIEQRLREETVAAATAAAAASLLAADGSAAPPVVAAPTAPDPKAAAAKAKEAAAAAAAEKKAAAANKGKGGGKGKESKEGKDKDADKGAGAAGVPGEADGGERAGARALLSPIVPVERVRIAMDAMVNSKHDITTASEQRLASSAMVTFSKGGTVSGTIDLCRHAQDNGWEVILSCEERTDDDCGNIPAGGGGGCGGGGGGCGGGFICAQADREDDVEFLADFAVGLRLDYVKCAGVMSLPHITMCNRLRKLEMDRQLGIQGGGFLGGSLVDGGGDAAGGVGEGGAVSVNGTKAE